jgi:uncharacterized protein (TIGR02145 family)
MNILKLFFITLIFISCKKKGQVNTRYLSDIDGNKYELVKVCNATFIKTNLNVSKYRNGDVIPEVKNASDWKNLTTGAWCYYDNDPLNAGKYGKLYNYYAVIDPRGLAPTGYHIPSLQEWTSLATCLGDAQAGGQLKSTGTLQTNTGLWLAPNLGATNSTSFSALPGGYRDKDGFFGNLNLDGIFWSRTENSTTNSWYFLLNANYANTGKYDNSKKYGFSVRVVAD